MAIEDRDPVGRVPTSTSPGSEGAHPQSGNYSFRCSEIDPTCNWEARGSNEQDIRRQIEQHGREKHNMSMTEDLWDKVKGKIRSMTS